MLGRLIIIDSSRKSVGAEKIVRSQKHMATKKNQITLVLFHSEAEPRIFGLRLTSESFYTSERSIIEVVCG